MVDVATVRRLAASLPGVVSRSTRDTLRFSVKGKVFAWTFRARFAAQGAAQTRTDVLAVRCAPDRKAILLADIPGTFFDDGYFNQYPAILVRLSTIGEAELLSILEEAWRA